MCNTPVVRCLVRFTACGLLAGSAQSQAHTIHLPASLVAADETITTVKTGISFGEGPAVDPDGNLYFSDREPSRIWKVPVGGSAAIFRNPADGANGMVFDAQGRLVVCEKTGISRIDKNGSVVKLVTADSLGSEGPNDLTLTSTGGIFFTSSVWDGNGKVYYLAPEGRLKTVFAFSTPPNYPNGIEFVEEKHLLYINITRKDSIMKCSLNDNGGITKMGGLCKTPSPDGIALDVAGNLWVANTNGNHQVTVFDSLGSKLGEMIIDGQESVQNLAFGGADGKILYIAGKTAIFSLKTVIAGRSTTGIFAVSLQSRNRGTGEFACEVPDIAREYRGHSARVELFDLRGARKISSAATVNEALRQPDMPCGTVIMRVAGRMAPVTRLR